MIAEWRKLWATVSLSTKVNQLSDQATILWVFAIPHFSVHGFLEYDPVGLKSKIVPKRRSITVEIIPGCVNEILKVKLWLAFRSQENRIILYDPRWFDKQNLRVERLGKVPYNIKEMTQIYDLLPETPGYSGIVQDTPGMSLIPGDSGTLRDTPGPSGTKVLPQGLVRERERERERERAEKESAAPGKDLPVDNFPAAPSSTQNEPYANPPLFESLFPGKVSFVDALCISIIASDPGFNPYQWIIRNKARNPDALIHSLKRLKDALQSKMGKSITSWPYIEAILKDEDKNYNSREFDTQANKDKAEFKTLVENLKALQEKTKATQ